MPILKQFEQGSAAWKDWRMGGVGASDAPVIMGVSPWTSRLELWELKTGRAPERPSNWAMRRGTQFEHVARKLYIQRTGTNVAPVCFEHGEHSWMRASLDGLSDDGRLVVEIKCPGRVDHDAARAGSVPAKYYAQLQHLMFVSGASECHYVSYREGDLVLIEVSPDHAYRESMFRAELLFWDSVRIGLPPAD